MTNDKPKMYTKRPVSIQALKWDGENQRAMFEFLEGCGVDRAMSSDGDNFYIDHNKIEGGLIIKTLEGEHIASLGDYIIRGIKGEFYPCKPDIFHKLYFEGEG
jgi:hypothetical protein